MLWTRKKPAGKRIMSLEFSILKVRTPSAKSFLSVVSCFGHFVWNHISVKMHYSRRLFTSFDHFFIVFTFWISSTLLSATFLSVWSAKTQIFNTLRTWYAKHKPLWRCKTNVIFRNFQFVLSHKEKILWCIRLDAVQYAFIFKFICISWVCYKNERIHHRNRTIAWAALRRRQTKASEQSECV